jgi:hypothetical protein
VVAGKVVQRVLDERGAILGVGGCAVIEERGNCRGGNVERDFHQQGFLRREVAVAGRPGDQRGVGDLSSPRQRHACQALRATFLKKSYRSLHDLLA